MTSLSCTFLYLDTLILPYIVRYGELTTLHKPLPQGTLIPRKHARAETHPHRQRHRRHKKTRTHTHTHTHTHTYKLSLSLSHTHTHTPLRKTLLAHNQIHLVNVCDLKLLVHEALSYLCMRSYATSVCGLKLLAYEALSY
jgi:hypothetical protein